MTFYRVRIADTDSCLRPLVVYLLWVTLFELRFGCPRLSSLLLDSNDVIRIHSSIHSQYLLVRHVLRKILPTHVLHLHLLLLMDRLLTVLIF